MKNIKTNVLRILDKEKIAYEATSYECDEFHCGTETAEILGLDPETVYKTLVCVYKQTYFVFVVPVKDTLDLKKCAVLAGVKNLELINYKDLLKITGYVRGGCSPIGMKKKFPTFFDHSILDHEFIHVSGGKVGLQIKIKPTDLLQVTDGKVGDLR